MKIVHEFPHAIHEIENCWIPLSDGCRLAARIWMPQHSETSPVPAILEYIPYRKRDGTRERDEPMHRWFAGHGYAAVRVDLRGSGDSDGLLLDEYLEREHDDALEVLGWIAAQPWCTGAIGMMGKSWGGFNALQVAARRPPQLKAVLSVCSTDDRYADDAHYMGGCLLNENLIWGSVLLSLSTLPPDPQLVGDGWRELWRQRLERTPLFPEIWLRHPSRDAYWRHGSVCEDFESIRCPVYAVGGWADGYSNAVPRLLAGLRVPRKGLVGPWAHLYPHNGVPGPAIGFLQEARRWWDRWLRGIENGIEHEPMYRAWMQEPVQPHSFYDTRPGRWVVEDAWPSSRISMRRFGMPPGRLAPEDAPAADHATLEVCSPQSVGLSAGAWCGFGVDGESPSDQVDDDRHSACFDSEALEEGLEILGAPEVTLTLSCDRPDAFVAVRLNEVWQDGASARVTYGLLNLTHRDGHASPQPLAAGKRYEVRVRLNDVAHRFAPGNRMRLAISTSYWPIAWPSPEPATVQLVTAGCHCDLPVRAARAADARLPEFESPEAAPEANLTDLAHGGVQRRLHRDPTHGETVLTLRADVDSADEPTAWRVNDIHLERGHGVIQRFSIRDDDPLSAFGEVIHKTVARRGDWSVRVHTRVVLRSTRDAFRLEAELDAWEGDTCVQSRRWKRSVPRHHV